MPSKINSRYILGLSLQHTRKLLLFYCTEFGNWICYKTVSVIFLACFFGGHVMFFLILFRLKDLPFQMKFEIGAWFLLSFFLFLVFGFVAFSF